MLTLVSKKTRLLVASVLLVIGLASSASAAFLPANKNPLLDTTGVNCGVDQNKNGTFFFLVGALDSTPVVRNCTVPVGKTIVFPVVNALYGAFPTDPAAERTEAYVRSQVEYAAEATGLYVEVDGTKVSNLNRYLEQSDLFNVTLPANNIFGADAGQVLSPAADSGYYIGLTPMIPGKHKIVIKGTLDGTSINVTYNLTQKATL
jgi:hypothetical protein